jgi:hypothetical protein
MSHSIAAKYAARPAARFPSSVGRAREPRLGLRPGRLFRSAPARPTLLRDPLPSDLARVRAGARTMSGLPAGRRRIGAGGMTWAVSTRPSRPSAHPAPWRA